MDLFFQLRKKKESLYDVETSRPCCVPNLTQGFCKSLEKQTPRRMSSRFVRVTGWPRWTLETVLRTHPIAVDFPERPGSNVDGMEEVETLECVSDLSGEAEEVVYAEARLRDCLSRIDEDVDAIALCDGLDADGTRHRDECIVLSRAPVVEIQLETVEDIAAAITASAIASALVDVDEPPVASFDSTSELDVDTVVVEKTDDVPPWLEAAATLPPREHVTRIVYNDTVVLELVGVLPPSLMTGLARQHVLVPSLSGSHVPLFRNGAQMRVGIYTVRPNDFDSETTTYVASGRNSSGVGPLRRRESVWRRERREAAVRR